MGDGLALCHGLVDLDEALNKSSVLGVRVVESVGNVDVGEVRLDGGVAGRDSQVDQHAVDKVDSAVDQRVVPDLGLSHLDRQTRDAVVDKRRLDTAWLADINLQRVRLQELAQALNVRQAPVRVAPQARLAARRRCVQVDANVDVGCVAPDIVPDVVGEDVGPAAAELGGYAREDAVHVCEGAGG